MSCWNKTFVCVIGFALLFSVLFAAEQEREEEKTQEFCPVLTEEKIDPNIFVEHEGKRVYLCCDFCKAQFLKNPDKYLENLPQFAEATTTESGEDDHEEHARPDGQSRLLGFIGKFHPIAVHFPIALVIVAALAEFLFLLAKRPWLGNAARFCIVIGAIGALVAAVTGFLAERSASYRGDYVTILERHEALGISAGVVIVLAAILSELARWKQSAKLRMAYRIALLAALAIVGLTGYYGGMLVHGIDHYAW